MYYAWDAHWVELSPNLWIWSGRFSNPRPTAWDDNQQELSVSTTTGLVIKGKPWKTDQIRNPHPTPGDELRRWVRFEDGFPLKHVLCAFSGDVDFQVPAMHIGPLGSPQKGALHQETLHGVGLRQDPSGLSSFSFIFAIKGLMWYHQGPLNCYSLVV